MIDFRTVMTVDVPEGECDGLAVRRFTVPEHSVQGAKLAAQGRDCPPGTYTKLIELKGPQVGAGQFWMSDTPAERSDHLDVLYAAQWLHASRVLINGLGLGMVIKALLTLPSVQRIDVVEFDDRVIRLVGPSYADERVNIHHADAYAQMRNWPVNTHWDVAWHDIWPSICSDNLPGMATLMRSYGRRTSWQGCWAQDACRDLLRRGY